MVNIVKNDNFDHFGGFWRKNWVIDPLNSRETSENVSMTSMRVANIIIHHPEGSKGA